MGWLAGRREGKGIIKIISLLLLADFESACCDCCDVAGGWVGGTWGVGESRMISTSLQVRWCSWLSRQSNTLKVGGSSPPRIMVYSFAFVGDVDV